MVTLSSQEVRETPGLLRALRTEPVTWTKRLRQTLADKGLNVEEINQIYVLGDGRGGYLFCNAANPREAHDLFREEHVK